MHCEWSGLSQQDVDPHVPLIPPNEQGISHVLLNDALLIVDELPDVLNQKYSPASAEVGRLTDPNLLTVSLSEFLDKPLVLIWQNEGGWREIVD